MSSLTFNQLTLSLAAAVLLATSLSSFASEPPTVVDPTSGETVSITEIDIASLSEEDRQNIGDQLAEQGIAPRGGRDRGEARGGGGRDGGPRGGGAEVADAGGEGRGGEGRGGEGGPGGAGANGDGAPGGDE
ncbi:hypothetical protein TRL7639_02206 [Falsiruegeria litorea R37]|uniref:Uncharacterized protein n=1 Tax=Falsiruegeria litorea R37 TaxID=1200284 RepID=A0A1Y5SQ50_9RHOB|nr:hypothetical protein [Falsiruegeria litorea]SLN42744.1 hypothetical protein TRL7639_02206 [Falsiruegeria litorea R37]